MSVSEAILRRHLVLHLSSIRNCPDCHSGNVRRSVRWGILETSVLPLLMLRPFRCEKCDCRYFGLFFAARTRKRKGGSQAQVLAKPVEAFNGTPNPVGRSIDKTIFCRETLDLGAEAAHEPAVNERLSADTAVLMEQP
jgi:hypothetical protein